MQLSVISKFLVVLGATLLAAFSAASSSQLTNSHTPDSKAGYHLTDKFSIGGEAGWDYLAIGPDARRVYVSHLTNVEAFDADTGKSMGQIKDTPGVHGIALVPKLNRAFTSNGEANTVSVIDLKTFAHLSEIKAGNKPDAIIYNPGAERVFASNGESDDVTAIDAATGKVVGTVAVGGAPEYSAADGKGALWVNLEDKNAFVTIDPKALKVIKTTPLPGCEEPASMALDPANRRLFIGCKNHLLAVVDPDSGKLIKTLPIGKHVDATVFDAANHLVFASTGDGVITIIHQDAPDAYTVVDDVKTMRGAKTMAFDPTTGKIFSATVENVPLNATGPANPKTVVYDPGPSVVLVVGK